MRDRCARPNVTTTKGVDAESLGADRFHGRRASGELGGLSVLAGGHRAPNTSGPLHGLSCDIVRVTRPSGWQDAARVVAVALALVVAVSCSDSNRADDEREPEPETEENDGSAAADDEQVVEAAYRDAAEARAEALAPPTPNPDHPALAETHTGPMLDQAREVATGLRAEGLAVRYPEDSELRIDVESVEFHGEDVAILDLCIVDDGERVDMDTGEVLAGGVFSGRVLATMERVDGRWKLAERELGEQQEGAGACAAD